MAAYIARRLLLMVPTLFGILLVSFVIVQFAPGGPVERVIAQLQGQDSSSAGRLGGGSDIGSTALGAGGDLGGKYRGAQGLDPKFVKELEKQFGFDKPVYERFWIMIRDFARFDFGQSYFGHASVLTLIKEKLPVSISLGLWMTLLSYAISIPLGVAKAVRDGSRFDVWTSAVITVGYALPSFLFAVLLIILFAGGSFFTLFPLRGLVSDNWSELDWPHRIVDYLWHITLPVTAMTIGAFAT
ncbi:MAG: ABC transporter permease subunit, partial [Parafilimonas terrae]|nr:ABC transporter permease subunit [Parafilimonas terrae]